RRQRAFGYSRFPPAPREVACRSRAESSNSSAQQPICPQTTLETKVNQRPPTRADAASAGGLLIGTMVACGAAGFGLGSLVGLADRKAGLAGALLAVAVVTTYFAAQGIAYVLDPEDRP